MDGIKLPELRRVGIVTDGPLKLLSRWYYEFPLSLNKMQLFYPDQKGKMASLQKLARINFHDLYDIPAFMLLTVIESLEKYRVYFKDVRQVCRQYYKNLHTLLMRYFGCHRYWHPSTKDVTLPGFLDIHWLKQDSRIIEFHCVKLKQIILMQAYYWLSNFAVAYFFQKEGIPWDDELSPAISNQIKEWYDLERKGVFLEQAVLVPRRRLTLI